MSMAHFEEDKTDDEISGRNERNTTAERLRGSLHETSLNGGMSADNLTRQSLRRTERRHVYHDITPLKTGSVGCQFDGANAVNGCEEGTQSRLVLFKPALPPKPKYILRDKKTRHVYQSINLSNTNETVSTPPPLPLKPPRLQRLKLSPGETPPPLPPRVMNQQAIQQRHRLDHEYFENLRKSVDEELLGLAEEYDLPVPLNLPITNNMQSSRFEYGAHSPPLNVSNTIEDLPSPTTRRHSLPLQERRGHEMHYGNDLHPTRSTGLRSNNLEPDIEAYANPSMANLAYNFLLLKRCGWYWGNMNWQEAEEMLSKNTINGKKDRLLLHIVDVAFCNLAVIAYNMVGLLA